MNSFRNGIISLALLVVLIAIIMVVQPWAQESPKPSAPVVAAVSAPVPQLSEVEMLRLQVTALQQQIVNVNAVLDACRIELAHPGYRFDPTTGKLSPPPPPKH